MQHFVTSFRCKISNCTGLFRIKLTLPGEKMRYKAFETTAIPFALFTVCMSAASANTVNNVEVTSVGNQGTTIYITLSFAPETCSSGILYKDIDASAPYIMSIALSARSANRLLSRIDYHKDANGLCYIDLIQI